MQRHIRLYHGQVPDVPGAQQSHNDKTDAYSVQLRLEQVQDSEQPDTQSPNLGVGSCPAQRQLQPHVLTASQQSSVLYTNVDNPHTQQSPEMISDDPYTADIPLSNDMLDFLSSGPDCFDFGGTFDCSSSPSHQGSQVFTTDRADAIPAERFAQVARLWPSKTLKSSSRKPKQDLWKEVVESSSDNIYTEPSALNHVPNSASRNESKWGLDEGKRQSLIQEFIVDRSNDPGDKTDDATKDSNFPTTRLLNLGLDIVFRQSHSHVPYIHRPTFTAETTSNSTLFALCLLGLSMLNSRPARESAVIYLPVCPIINQISHVLLYADDKQVATKDCCARLARFSDLPGGSLELVTNLVSATLLLTAWSICPVIVYSNPMSIPQLSKGLYDISLLLTNHWFVCYTVRLFWYALHLDLIVIDVG